MEAVCRKATDEDVETLVDLIAGYAEKGIMLPRSRETLKRQIETFVVAEVRAKSLVAARYVSLAPIWLRFAHSVYLKDIRDSE